MGPSETVPFRMVNGYRTIASRSQQVWLTMVPRIPGMNESMNLEQPCQDLLPSVLLYKRTELEAFLHCLSVWR